MKFLLLTILISLCLKTNAQDTTVVQTIAFDSSGRSYNFIFPDDSETYRKIIMQYRMRCKNNLISNSSNPNQGCGEWDYSCNTFLTDSTKFDSVQAVHPNFIVSGFNGTLFNYTTQQTYTYFSYGQQSMTNTGIVSENISSIGSGIVQESDPFSTSKRIEKSQYLLTAAELTTAGLTSNVDITSLKLDLTTIGGDVNFLRIKLKSTSKTALNDSLDIDVDGFTEVYFQNTPLTLTGLNDFAFYSPFSWDGTSNLIVEFSYTNSVNYSNSNINSTNTGSAFGIKSKEDDYYIKYNGGGSHLELQNSLNFGSNQDFTVELWVKPEQSQNDPVILSDKNWASGSNKGFVIFQNGSTWRVNIGDGTNREDVTGGDIFSDGKWHHIAVSFDRDGLMRLYQDGIEVASANLATDPIGDINSGNTIKIGQDGTGTYGIDWLGEVDNIRVWNTLLSANEINNWKSRLITNQHPKFTFLEVDHSLNSISAGSFTDQSTTGNNALMVNGPQHIMFRGNEVFKDFEQTPNRPNLSFVQGVYLNSNVTALTVLDSIENAPNLVEEFQVVNNNLISNGSQFYFESGNMSIINAQTGAVIGTVAVPSQNSLNIFNLNYFSKHPSKIELMSFVTPYGLGLNLGIEGKMWEFDMTDFTTILRDQKYLSVEFAGAYQEELDIRFLFIEGTPPRDVINLQQIWRPGARRGYVDLIANTYFEPRDVSLSPSASMFKLRSAITGHGQEGEFIPRQHYLNVNGGINELDWQVWKECADNPVYPQGGTWVYDRAGWCPGAPTDTKIYEIDPATITGNTVNIDYGVTNGSGTSDYYISSQLVSYGNPNFSNDASITEIKRPSLKVENERFNPICSYPIIVIQNTGANNLTALTINYNVAGGPQETYNWTGNLSFLKQKKLLYQFLVRVFGLEMEQASLM